MYLLCKVLGDAANRKALYGYLHTHLSLLMSFSCYEFGNVACNEIICVEDRRKELGKLYLSE